MSDSKKEKVVYFVRHGESKDNIAPVFQAQDSPLSEAGREQAKRIAERIKKLSFETLISSPLPRARETAEAIAKTTGKTVEYSNLFVERIKPSSISGKSYDDKEANRLWEEWEKSLYTSGMRAEDGENFDDLIERADRALDFLKNHPGKELVVVTHGFFLRTIIIRVLLGESLTEENFKKFKSRATMENAGLSAIKYVKGWEKMEWRLWIYNDHAHLG
jgi:broad specificity phosphatase PhoE